MSKIDELRQKLDTWKRRKEGGFLGYTEEQDNDIIIPALEDIYDILKELQAQEA